MGGESHANGNANAYHATSRGVHPPAKAARIAANGRSGKGRAGKGGGRGSCVEKRKFTVIMRGLEWSAVPCVNETLEEFAAAIVRDARRLAFGENGDSIQRLQLGWSEDFEPSERAKLGNVNILCKGDKQLFAIVKRRLAIENSTQLTPSPRVPRTGIPKQRPDSECTAQHTNAITRNCHDSVAARRSSPNLLVRSTAPKFPFPDYEPPCSGALTTNSGASKNYIPPESPSLQFQPVEKARSFHPDYVAGTGANLPPSPRSSGELNMGGAGEEKSLRSLNHPGGANNAKRSLCGATSHGNSKEKSPSSSNSSANVRNSLTSQSGDGEGLDNELPDGGCEILFPVLRRSKTRLQGVGTHYLKMSDISAYFHLPLLHAAEALGVSPTTLKKACRYFELKRWPGRKVRSLLRTLDDLQDEEVGGQGAGLEEMTEASKRPDVLKLLQEMTKASMRSDILKLLQEMDQLVHDTPAQVRKKMRK